MNEIMTSIIKVIVFSATSFAVLFIIAKILGKKQIAQLDFVDYVIGISLGSIAADMTVETEKPWYIFVIAMAVFFLLDMVISFLGRKGPFMKRLLKGKPIVLIYEGNLISKNLKKSRMDINDLLLSCRQQGYFDLGQIAYALIETNGMVSIMPIGKERPTVAKDLPIDAEKASLPNYLVIDGHISFSGLNELGKDSEWLLKKLKITSKKELKNILLASYDYENKKVNVTYKN